MSKISLETHPVTLTIWRQIGINTKMSIGAREPFTDEENRTLMFRVGPARPYQNIMITLNAMDTYDIKFYVITPNLDIIREEDVKDIYVENLNETLCRMVDNSESK